jgi:hypothetical protein
MAGPKLLETETTPEIQGTMQMIDGTLHTTEPLEKLWQPAINMGRRQRV